MCADLVKVRVREAGGIREVVANLEDISPSGACLQMEDAASEGSGIEIVCAGCRLKGSVRYCRFVGMGYDVGIAFEERESWTRERFEPKHLLLLPTLRSGAIGAAGGSRPKSLPH